MGFIRRWKLWLIIGGLVALVAGGGVTVYFCCCEEEDDEVDGEHKEGGRSFLMERAVCFVGLPRPLQGYVIGDHFQDV